MNAASGPDNFFRRVAWFGVLAVAALSILEIFARLTANPAVRFRRAERALHCLGNGTVYVVLCANQRIDFVHPAGFAYRVTTNHAGERTAYPSASEPVTDLTRPAVWIIGDSIAMGFGNDDRATFAALLARERPEYQIRNLGVDALGACGIRHIFQQALDQTTAPITRKGAAPRNARHPRYVIGILNPSDYTDDLRDRARSSAWFRGAAFRARFYFTKYFALPDYLRELIAPDQTDNDNRLPVKSDAPVAPTDSEHPTFQCTREIFQIAEHARDETGSRFILLVYPDVDHTTGKPLATDPLKAPIVALAREFPAVRVLDLQESFERNADPGLYLRDDGHPGPAAQRLFTLGVQQILD